MVLEASQNEVVDDVDRILANEDGQIQRPRDPNLCRHNARQKCTNCLPLDVSNYHSALQSYFSRMMRAISNKRISNTCRFIRM